MTLFLAYLDCVKLLPIAIQRNDAKCLSRLRVNPRTDFPKCDYKANCFI